MRYKPFKKWLTAVFWLICATSSVDAATDPERDLISRALESVEFQTFIAGFKGSESLNESIRKVTKLRSTTLQCVAKHEKQLESSVNVIGQDILDQLQEKESLSAEEEHLSEKVSSIKEDIRACKLLLNDSNDLLDRLTELQSELRQEELGKKNPSFYSLVKSGISGIPSHLKLTVANELEVPGVELGERSTFTGLWVIIFGLLAGGLLRRKAKPPVIVDDQSFSAHLASSTAYLAIKWSPLLIALTAFGAYMFFILGYQFSHSKLNKLLGLGIAFIFLQILIRVGIHHISKTRSPDANATFPIAGLHIRLVIATTLLGIWMLLVVIPDSNFGKSTPHLLFDSFLSLVLICSHIDLAIFLRRLPSMPLLAKCARLTALTLFGISFALELFGYSNLSRLLWSGVVLSALILAGFYLLEKLSRDFFDGIDAGQRPWQRGFRQFLSLEEGEPIPGLIWLRLVAITVLWIALLFGILKSWDVSEATIASLVSYARNGFKIGNSLVTPSNVVIGVLTFAVLLMVSRWLRDGLDKKYLSRSRMDIGAREAMTTIIGYIGFVVAALIGLTIAGFSLSNLAIVAGALSLGIGFGLQNIVNNFVSGIILLFERPIKTGDWIVAGTTEGYVKKIRVRSTEVQTFDRSEVIVPNSELVSTQVTNWTLRDKYGRIKINVGVAYGSNTELVKELLESVTVDVPEIVHNRPTLPIKVLFLGFGESTLDFELRCYIFDIGYILDVKSKLHFAIDKVFRENDIEIAFPQRDIHIKTGSLATDSKTND